MHDLYDKHIPSRTDIIIGMAADAWRRCRDRRESVQNRPAEADDRLARDLDVDRPRLMNVVGGMQWRALLRRRLRTLGIDPDVTPERFDGFRNPEGGTDEGTKDLCVQAR